jgi:plasmid stabilization system protein ParE
MISRRWCPTIKADSPSYAQTFGLHIQQRVEQLHYFPDSGRKVPEDRTDMYRELIVGNYRLVYRVDADLVTIVTLIHGARLLHL